MIGKKIFSLRSFSEATLGQVMSAPWAAACCGEEGVRCAPYPPHHGNTNLTENNFCKNPVTDFRADRQVETTRRLAAGKRRRLAAEPPARNIYGGDAVTWWEFDHKVSYEEAQRICHDNAYPAGPEEHAEAAHVLNLDKHQHLIVGSPAAAFEMFWGKRSGGPLHTETKGSFWVHGGQHHDDLTGTGVPAGEQVVKIASINEESEIFSQRIDLTVPGKHGWDARAGVICVKTGVDADTIQRLRETAEARWDRDDGKEGHKMSCGRGGHDRVS